jgi:hypothetical protein
MNAQSPHAFITSSRVVGAPVFNLAGDRIGHVYDLSVEKETGQVMYGILSIGGFLGVGERFHPLPWSILTYDPDKSGFVVNLDKEVLKDAPSLTREELEDLGAGEAWSGRVFDYYGAYGAYGAAPYI